MWLHALTGQADSSNLLLPYLLPGVTILLQPVSPSWLAWRCLGLQSSRLCPHAAHTHNLHNATTKSNKHHFGCRRNINDQPLISNVPGSQQHPPPAAAMTSKRWPGWGFAKCSDCQAVSPTNGTPPAVVRSTPSGTLATQASSQTTYWQYVPAAVQQYNSRNSTAVQWPGPPPVAPWPVRPDHTPHTDSTCLQQYSSASAQQYSNPAVQQQNSALCAPSPRSYQSAVTA